MQAPQTARTVRESGESQYAWSASPTISTKLAILLLLGPTLRDLAPKVADLRRRFRSGVLEDVGHRRPAEGVDDPVDHGGHGLSIGSALLESVEDLLLALLAQRDEVLVDESVQGRRHARVRHVPGVAHLVEDLPRRRGPEVSDGAEHREFELSQLHTEYYMNSNLIKDLSSRCRFGVVPTRTWPPWSRHSR